MNLDDLIPCRSCGTPIGDRARRCPMCGVDNPHSKGRKPNSPLLRLVPWVVIPLALFGWCYSMTSDTRERAEAIVAKQEARKPTRFREAPSTTRIMAGLRRMYASKTINVRTGPGTNNAIAYKLDPADLTYIGRTNGSGWAAVHGGPASADTVGFVKAELLKAGSPPDMMLMDYSTAYADQFGSAAINARVMNTTSRDMRYASIRWEITDASGAVIETAMDNIAGIRAGQVWRSQALVRTDERFWYRIAEITGR